MAAVGRARQKAESPIKSPLPSALYVQASEKESSQISTVRQKLMFTNINYPSKIDIHKYQLSVKRSYSHMSFLPKVDIHKVDMKSVSNLCEIPVKSL